MKKNIGKSFLFICEILLIIMIIRNTVYPFAYILLILFMICHIILFSLFGNLKNEETGLRKAIDNGNPDSVSTALDKLAGNKILDEKIIDTVFEYVNWRIRQNNTEVFNKQTEFAALQSQINPHFLYNTLDSIRSEALMNNDPEVANMIETLASLFRYSISHKGNLVPLRDELENTNNYMKIQRYRFNNRFTLETQIDEEDLRSLDYFVPRLLLQPIVENAIYHGLENMSSGGIVTIDATLSDSDMILTVSDNGKGMNLNELNSLNNSIHSSDPGLNIKTDKSGIALANSNKRIQLCFGEKYGINIYSTEGFGTDVEIIIPITEEGDSNING